MEKVLLLSYRCYLEYENQERGRGENYTWIDIRIQNNQERVPNYEQQLQDPGPGRAFFGTRVFADLLKVLHLLFSWLEVEYRPVGFMLSLFVSQCPGPGLQFVMSFCFTSFILQPGQLVSWERTYFPEGFRDSMDRQCPGPGFFQQEFQGVFSREQIVGPFDAAKLLLVSQWPGYGVYDLRKRPFALTLSLPSPNLMPLRSASKGERIVQLRGEGFLTEGFIIDILDPFPIPEAGALPRREGILQKESHLNGKCDTMRNLCFQIAYPWRIQRWTWID